MSTILIVDDNKMLLEMLQDYPEADSPAHVVLMAAKVTEARRLFRDTKPDLVIMDIILPGADGLELLKQFKELDSHFKSIILTGVNDDRLKEAARALGVDLYALKPVDPDQLKIVIQRLLSIAGE